MPCFSTALPTMKPGTSWRNTSGTLNASHSHTKRGWATGNQGLSMLTSQPIQGVLLEYDLPDATGSSVRAEMKRIKPDVPVLLFAGVERDRISLRFFDSYLRNADRPEWAFQDLDA